MGVHTVVLGLGTGKWGCAALPVIVCVGLCVHVYGESLGPREELQRTAAYALRKWYLPWITAMDLRRDCSVSNSRTGESVPCFGAPGSRRLCWRNWPLRVELDVLRCPGGNTWQWDEWWPQASRAGVLIPICGLCDSAESSAFPFGGPDSVLAKNTLLPHPKWTWCTCWGWFHVPSRAVEG